jgi:hypothetical protein
MIAEKSRYLLIYLGTTDHDAAARAGEGEHGKSQVSLTNKDMICNGNIAVAFFFFGWTRRHLQMCFDAGMRRAWTGSAHE